MDCKLDWSFPKYNPNPEDLKMLHEISKVVKSNKADIGFGFDGDGDRVGVIDTEGNEIFSDKIGLLIARNLSNLHKNSKFIVDVKSTGLYENDEILKNNKDLDKFLENIIIIEKDLISIFEKNRIKKINTQNIKFDPNLHQAMSEIEDDKVETGTILQEIQPGYMLGERLLRPALVDVAKKKTAKKEEKIRKKDEK